MKPSVLYVTLGVTTLAVAAAVYLMVDDPGPDPGTLLPACEVAEIPFAVAVTVEAAPDFDPIHQVDPKSIHLPDVLDLHDESGLETSHAELCTDPAADGSACGGIDSFSWGLDWIPLKDNTDHSYWYLTDFADGKGPGWGIIFFERGGGVLAWGWGPLLNDNWPEQDKSVVPPKDINLGLMRESTDPAGSGQPVLHRAEAFGLREGADLDGLDFHAWVPKIGEGWDPDCFTPPGGSLDVDPRLHYTLRRPAEGEEDAGAIVYWTEPDQVKDGVWVWSQPERLCTNVIPNLPAGADIDALGYYKLPTDEAGEEERSWLTQATTETMGGLPVVGLVMFSLTDDSFEDGEEHSLDPEDAYWIATVHADGVDQVFGPPRPVMTHLGTPLGMIVGPRSRGVCPSDPRLLRPDKAENR